MSQFTLIDGKAVSAKILQDIKEEVGQLASAGITPGLAVVLVGQDPASQVYVNSKERTCTELGLYSEKIILPADTQQQELLDVVNRLNASDKVHGILVQSPLPAHLDEEAIVRAIAPNKDVDGFHPENVAKLTMEDSTGFVACTPAGCMELLKHYNIETEGKEAVVIGRSLIVGKPMALLLMGKQGQATVTVVHSRTKNASEVIKRADIIVAALGKSEFVGTKDVKDGAVIIDVGINRVDDATNPRGYRLTGDVDFEAVKEQCSAITPVPGGVGPMTIAMLMQNTLKAAKQIEGYTG